MTYLLIMVIFAIAAILLFKSKTFLTRENRNGDEVSVGPKIAWGLIVVMVLWTLVRFYAIVPTGKVRIARTFGVISDRALTEGFNLKAPWQTADEDEDINVQYTMLVSKSGGKGAKVISKDQVQLTNEVDFPYHINPLFATKLKRLVADYIGLFNNLAQSANRDASAEMPWADASINKRAVYEKLLQEKLVGLVVENLNRAGFTEVEAKQVVVFGQAIVKECKPSDRILAENDEKQASEVMLGRQMVLTKIATEQGNRRASEGLGIKRMFAELPAGYTPEQIARIIEAHAKETTAEAIQKGIETGKVKTVILSPGGTSVNAN